MRTEILELKVRVELSGMDQKGGVFGIAAPRATVPPHSWPRCPAKRSCLGRAGFKYPKVSGQARHKKPRVNPDVTQGRISPSSPAEASQGVSLCFSGRQSQKGRGSGARKASELGRLTPAGLPIPPQDKTPHSPMSPPRSHWPRSLPHVCSDHPVCTELNYIGWT